MRRTLKLTALATAAILVVALLATFLAPMDPREREAASLANRISVEKVKHLYKEWVARHEANGGDHNVRLGLGYAKGLSVASIGARGAAKLNLLDGEVEVEVYGLPQGTKLEVWLVDNQAGSSAVPELNDRMVYLGALSNDGTAATLKTTLDAATLASFEVDVVVVTKAGYDPVDGPLLFGSPGAFQRLYTQARRGRLGEWAPQDTSTALLTTPAFAGGIFVDPDVLTDKLVAQGADLFINETFMGNGRTCATCHPATNSFTIDPEFIATLDDSDPLFIAEQDPINLPPGEFENPTLMRNVGLILENLDGFDKPGLMRSVPHVLALGTSITGPELTLPDGTPIPPFDNTFNPPFGIFPPADRTGWSSDGAPGSGSLFEFATGAVMQHFPKTIARVPCPTLSNVPVVCDFRLPTDKELMAMELFQLALGRTSDLNLKKLRFRNPIAKEGVRIFTEVPNFPDGTGAGRCVICHDNAGANINGDFFGDLFGNPPPGQPPLILTVAGNANFGTGVNDLPFLPADIFDAPGNPRDGGFARVSHSPAAGACIGGKPDTSGNFGFGTVTPPGGPIPPGLCEEDFNTAPLIEAADTGPFFHNNAVTTIEAAVAFYNNDAFNLSNGAALLANNPGISVPGSRAINLETTEVTAIATMLRLLNVRENLRSARDLIRAAHGRPSKIANQLLLIAEAELIDALEVLICGDLHPRTAARIRKAIEKLGAARVSVVSRQARADESLAEIDLAEADLFEGVKLSAEVQ